MNKKDKQLIKDSALAIADTIVATIPPLAVAWGLSKALYGGGLKLRQQRALEWVETIRDNPAIFTQDVLDNEEFQDGFVFLLEKFLIERNEKRRTYLRSIFLSFSQSEVKSNFELERFSECISRLDENDMDILKYVNIKTPNSYQIFDDQKGIENIYNLVNVGILYLDPSVRWNSAGSPYVFTSSFGRRFIKYLKRE